MVDSKDIDKLASLSRIQLSDDEKKELLGEFDGIISYISEIQSIATEDPNEEERIGILKNVMREDTDPTEAGTNTKDIMKRAPKEKDGYFKVKKILS